MAEAYHEGEHKQPAPEKQADRVERKTGIEASHGMEDRNKTIVAEVLKKRQERKSGGTDQLNKDDHKGKRVASAGELLPLDKPGKHHITEAPGQHQKLEAPQHRPEAPNRTEPSNIERAKEAATKALQGVIGGGLYEGASIPKRIAERSESEKTRFVPAGTPLEIRGHVYQLNELTAQSQDRASDARDKPKDNPMAGVPTVVGKDGIRRLDGHFQPEPSDGVKLINAVGKAIDPVTNAISRFNTESTKALNNLMDHGKEAVGLNQLHEHKPVHEATGDGTTLPKPIQNPGDAVHLGVGAATGFTKAVNEMMPGLTPRGALNAATETAKQVPDLAKEIADRELKKRIDPVGFVHEEMKRATEMHKTTQEWANNRSQTESFAQRGQDIGKASPDIMSLSEIVFIAKSGKLITPRDATKLQLETKTPEELDRLGIQRTMADKLKPEDIVNPIDRNATPPEKVRQLEKLSAENKPLVEAFTKQIDEKFGTKSSEPNMKEPKDILLKSVRAEMQEKNPWFGVEHVRDSLRFKTPVDDLSLLPAIAKELKESNFQVIKVDVDKLLNPKGRGWRMAAFDLPAPNGQIIEYQILSKEMNEAGAIEHSTYKNWREAKVDELSTADKQLRKDAMTDAKNLYENAENAYLRRTGQSPADLKRFVEAVYKIFEDQPK